MVGTLWTGISGLAGQQTALDNESNNIANVNTIGYKASRISFADQMYQDKIGKGTTILDAEKLYKQGNLKLTGVAYDMALSGDGFFAVSNTRGSGTAETFYTRAGNFRMGDNGKLQDAAGNEVQGWPLNAIDATNDVTTTNSNVTIFTDGFSKLAASQIIKKSTAVETITAKMTDYTLSAKADNTTMMTGAGYKTKSTKVADIEALITSYSSKLTAYASSPDATSSPSTAQKSYLNYDLDNATVDTGDQIFVYINGIKYAQTFNTNEKITMQKLTDQLSNIPGLNAFIAEFNDTTSAVTDSPASAINSDNPDEAIRIESLIPGKNFTIGDVGIVHDGITTLKNSGTDIAAASGTGYGAVLSAMEALRDVVAGKQRDVLHGDDIGTIGTDDKMEYSMVIDDITYSVSIQEGETSVTTLPTDNSNTISSALTDTNKVDMIVEAINEDPNMSKKVIARNINGMFVVESLKAGEEFTGTFGIDYFPTTVTPSNTGDGDAILENGETWHFDMSGTINNDEEIELNFTVDTDDSGTVNAGDTAYKIIMKGNSKSVTVTTTPNGGSTTTTSITLSSAITSGNAAAMLAEAFEQVTGLKDNGAAAKDANTSTQFNLGYQAHKGIAISMKYGNNTSVETKNVNSDYSINSGAHAEFMQIKTTIDQTASKGGMQLRLDTLGISNSAFGDFSVDSSGLITMKQDGAEFAVGQVAIALFNDNRGLEPRGDNLLATTTRSGTAIYNINNNKTADVKAKTLELSTADLSESLVNLMVFQRAFEANAKSITTADTILNTLIQLKR